MKLHGERYIRTWENQPTIATILVKLVDFKEKEKNCQKDQVTYKGKKVRLSSDFGHNVLCQRTLKPHIYSRKETVRRQFSSKWTVHYKGTETQAILSHESFLRNLLENGFKKPK